MATGATRLHPRRSRRAGRPACSGTAPTVVDLTDCRAADSDLTGAKAANLARAAAAGLPVLPGFVLTVEGRPDDPALRRAWERLSGGGQMSLVVRSSSTVEDDSHSSMAGQFRSVLNVRGWERFVAAVAEVLASVSAAAGAGRGDPAPMAVLVQRELLPVVSGVLFTLDPVTGDRRHLVADAVEGSPHPLVSGEVEGSRHTLSRTGRLVESPRRLLLDGPQRKALAALARRVVTEFAGPQDVEWGFDRNGHVWLLQSRPITVSATGGGQAGPLLGPGPVSETFPHRLRPLEAELWAAPLAAGIGDALRLVGAVSARRLRHSPPLRVVGGWVAADLDLLGDAPRRRSLARLLDPRGPARRVAAAWRVGQLKATFERQAKQASAQVDAKLAAVPRLGTLADRDLAGMVERAADELRAVHRAEVLAGMVLPPAEGAPTGAALALVALGAGRAAAKDEAEIVAEAPVVLALTAPRVGMPEPLPPVPGALAPLSLGSLSDLPPREALRLRARWLQELTARATTELGRRLSAAGRLPDAEAVAYLTRAELASVTAGGEAPGDLGLRRAVAPSPPLPPAFRLGPAGEVLAVSTRGDGGRGAGGGRGVGVVVHEPGAGTVVGGVLVVETLSPELAPLLSTLGGLVAETGSPLSHLAILARESGVPTVVAVPDARRRFPPGSTVVVDGGTGEVAAVGGEDEVVAA